MAFRVQAISTRDAACQQLLHQLLVQRLLPRQRLQLQHSSCTLRKQMTTLPCSRLLCRTSSGGEYKHAVRVPFLGVFGS